MYSVFLRQDINDCWTGYIYKSCFHIFVETRLLKMVICLCLEFAWETKLLHWLLVHRPLNYLWGTGEVVILTFEMQLLLI